MCGQDAAGARLQQQQQARGPFSSHDPTATDEQLQRPGALWTWQLNMHIMFQAWNPHASLSNATNYRSSYQHSYMLKSTSTSSCLEVSVHLCYTLSTKHTALLSCCPLQVALRTKGIQFSQYPVENEASLQQTLQQLLTDSTVRSTGCLGLV